MGAPIGNKNAKGHGRPIEYDREEWGDKLLEWAKKDDSLNVCEFAADNDIATEYLCEWARDNDYFSQCYKKAKAKIASRRHKKMNNNEYNYGVYMRQLNVYDTHNKIYEREEKEFEANLKRMMNDDELRSQLDQFLQKFNPK